MSRISSGSSPAQESVSSFSISVLATASLLGSASSSFLPSVFAFLRPNWFFSSSIFSASPSSGSDSAMVIRPVTPMPMRAYLRTFPASVSPRLSVGREEECKRSRCTRAQRQTETGNETLLRSVTEQAARSTRESVRSQAVALAGVDVGTSFPRRRSRSSRKIAFNFPPSSKNKHVRYIQKSNMMMDASAR